jgi:hypothetical protein
LEKFKVLKKWGKREWTVIFLNPILWGSNERQISVALKKVCKERSPCSCPPNDELAFTGPQPHFLHLGLPASYHFPLYIYCAVAGPLCWTEFWGGVLEGPTDA